MEVLDIPYDKAEKINQLRLYFLMESRNRHLSEVLELSVNLLSMKKNTARGLALLALLKSALARFDLITHLFFSDGYAHFPTELPSLKRYI